MAVWIELQTSVVDHDKLKDLSRLVGEDPVHLVGHLCALWLWTIEHEPYGDLSKLGPLRIASRAHWHGDPEQFFEALHTAQLLVRQDGKTMPANWLRYAGRYIELLEQKELDKARKAAERRLRRLAQTEALARAVAEEEAEPVHDLPHENHTDSGLSGGNSRTSGHDPTLPNLTGPDQTGPDLTEPQTRLAAAIAGDPAAEGSSAGGNDDLSTEAGAPLPEGNGGEEPTGGQGGGVAKGDPENSSRGGLSRAIWATFIALGCPSPETPSERRSWNVAIKEIVDAGGTTAEVRRRAAILGTLYPGIRLTPHGLASHWGDAREIPESKSGRRGGNGKAAYGWTNTGNAALDAERAADLQSYLSQKAAAGGQGAGG